MKLSNAPVVLGLVVLALAVPVAVYLSTQQDSLTLRTQAGKEKVAVLYLWPAAVETTIQEEIGVKIYLTTENKDSQGVTTKIIYDPQVLSLKSIDRGVIFNKYTEKTINEAGGTCTIAAQGDFNGTGTLATLNFVAKKAGESKLDVVLEDSQVVGSAGDDILQGVNGGLVIVN